MTDIWIVEAYWFTESSRTLWVFDDHKPAANWASQLYVNGATVTWWSLFDTTLPVVQEPGCRPV